MGEFFGFASMLEQTPHQTSAMAVEEAVCIEVDRHDIAMLLERKPLAGMDMLDRARASSSTARSNWCACAPCAIPTRSSKSRATLGDRIADAVARFGGSWTFIITFGRVLVVYTAINIWLGTAAWDPYPFILLNLFLSMLAAVQAPVIMMSQNRQDAKDRLRGELDYDVNRRAEAEIQGLARKLNLLGEKIEDVEDLIRDRLQKDGPAR